MSAQRKASRHADPLEWLTVADVAERLAVKQNTLRSWVRRGTGPTHYKLGALVRFRPADVDAWLEASRR